MTGSRRQGQRHTRTGTLRPRLCRGRRHRRGHDRLGRRLRRAPTCALTRRGGFRVDCCGTASPGGAVNSAANTAAGESAAPRMQCSAADAAADECREPGDASGGEGGWGGGVHVGRKAETVGGGCCDGTAVGGTACAPLRSRVLMSVVAYAVCARVLVARVSVDPRLGGGGGDVAEAAGGPRATRLKTNRTPACTHPMRADRRLPTP